MLLAFKGGWMWFGEMVVVEEEMVSREEVEGKWGCPSKLADAAKRKEFESRPNYNSQHQAVFIKLTENGKKSLVIGLLYTKIVYFVS